MFVIYVNGACVGVAETLETAITVFKNTYLLEYADTCNVEYVAIIAALQVKDKLRNAENDFYAYCTADINEDCWIEKVPCFK